ncbi:MAG: pilin glycosylation ligase domain-containing protein, partial [Vogesella sp.]|nr:pilin glycosylation ligase domain-containing protein [Vogesella sp.]
MLPTAILLPLLLVYILPLLNFARYSPVQDWWTNALTLVLVAVPLLLASWQARRDQARFTTVPWFLPGFALWWLLLWLGSLWRYQQHSAGMLPFELFGVLLVALGACLLAAQQDRWGRECLVVWLAYAVLAGALLQALIGVAQIAGWAPSAKGWLVFNGREVMGNAGQRNQFAHVLSWGVVAVAYLLSRQRLQLGLAAVLVMFLSLLAAWSGGRLPLAYAGAMVAVGLLWHRREPQLRIGQALLWAAAVVILFQLAGKPLALWLFGLDIGSGLDRLGDAGFGARRRVEWAKCWEIVQAYPWLGTGYGGYGYQSVWLETFGGLTKVPESSLFTHSHSLITQLAAETGVPATLLAASVAAAALWPYLQRQHATAENAFLLLMGVITLGHSMFEYPLWYLPFLFAFFVVLALSPKA